MAATDVIKTALERNWGMVDRALEGMDDAALARQPNDESNSIAWLLWHMTRVVDVFIHTRLQPKTQLWVQDGWHQKFGMSDDTSSHGGGWSLEQVAELISLAGSRQLLGRDQSRAHDGDTRARGLPRRRVAHGGVDECVCGIISRPCHPLCRDR